MNIAVTDFAFLAYGTMAKNAALSLTVLLFRYLPTYDNTENTLLPPLAFCFFGICEIRQQPPLPNVF
ncbi:MAG: hypothetical protein PHW69_03495 [Elusimicrobiaceae bacterium]|nr:hypothetical protein [Elusimicrobiaceae bacterium]